MKYNQEITLKNGRAALLRNGVAADAAAVVENLCQAHAETDYLLSYPDECSLDAEKEAALLEEKTASANEIEIVAFVDGEVAGTAGIKAVGSKYKVRHRSEFGISILRKYWGLGLGRALMQACIQMAREAGAVVQMVDRSRLDAIYPSHQGLIAYVSPIEYSTVEKMLAIAQERGEEPFLILLDGITDPHNLGAIIRTAECVGAHGVIVPERRSAGLTPAAAKAAAGALNHMPIARVTNLNRTIDELKEKGVWIIGAAMDGESAFTCDLTGPAALVIGSEGDGISRLTMEKCDRRVSLPMKGHLDSLNASVAAGVLMYAVRTARGD